MTFSSGYKIGAYSVVRPLGQGGMGAVYEVEHERLGTRYALKVLTAGESCDGLLKNKFLAEGKLLARLKDPRVVRDDVTRPMSGEPDNLSDVFSGSGVYEESTK